MPPTEISNQSLIREAKSFHTKKRLGQHFLIDVEALQAIVDALELQAGETAIEIGPGAGFLTRFLARTGASIVAIELDRESIDELRAAKYPNVALKHGDFLSFDLNRLQFFRKGRNDESAVSPEPELTERIKVVGNVPYQITGPIIGRLLGEVDKPSPWLSRIDRIVLMVQREVAERMLAKAGDREYSRVSILVQQYCRPELVQVVPSASFFPPPKVDSAIVRLNMREAPLVRSRNLRLMRKLIEAGFRQRRKMYRNAISFLRLPPAQIDSVFAKLSIDPLARAETLSIQQFAMLADAFDEIVQDAEDQGDSAGEDQSDI